MREETGRGVSFVFPEGRNFRSTPARPSEVVPRIPAEPTDSCPIFQSISQAIKPADSLARTIENSGPLAERVIIHPCARIE